jgi:hypothetical protein
MTENKTGNSAPAPSPVALVHNTRPVAAKVREINNTANNHIRPPNPDTPQGLQLILWLMILMLLVKFAILLFGR